MSNQHSLRIILDGKFFWHEGRAYSGHMHYELFARKYLEAGVDDIVVCGRAYDTITLPSGAKPLDGPRVRFERLARYKGASQFIASIPGIIGRCWSLACAPEQIMLYVPGTLPFIVLIFLLLSRKPFGCLVVADPADQMGAQALRHPLQPYARRLYMWLLAVACRNARAVLYVTQKYLQRDYPGRDRVFEFGASDVNITRDFIVERKGFSCAGDTDRVKFVYVAAMVQAYKGHDVLLKAAQILLERTSRFEVVLVGGGALKAGYQQMAFDLGVSSYVQFAGQIDSRDELRSILDSTDIFVIPSRAEGLPRAVVEAMARGLPVIGTDVGGMFELVPSERLVQPDSPQALANLMWECCEGRYVGRLDELSRSSISVAETYLPEITSAVRRAFVESLFRSRC